MADSKDSKGTLYHIKVKGNLDPKWADWFEGFILESHGDGETLLTGKMPDQAALHGMLSKINNLGLRLILVLQVDDPDTTESCPLCGQRIGLMQDS
jgi:hypothetical protein